MKCLFSLMLMICCNQLIAQNGRIGIRGGVGFSNFYNHNSSAESPSVSMKPDDGTTVVIHPPTTQMSAQYYETNFIKDMRSGVYSGIIVDIDLETKWRLETGFGYLQRGINVDYTMTSSSVNSDNSTTEIYYQFIRNLRLDYISIPVVFHYKLGKKERFYVSGGLYNSLGFNFLINNSSTTYYETTYYASNGGGTSSSSVSSYTKAYIHVFDLGLVGGAGVQWPLTESLVFGIDIRGITGLLNVPAKFDEVGFLHFSQNTKNISFETGVKFLYVLR